MPLAKNTIRRFCLLLLMATSFCTAHAQFSETSIAALSGETIFGSGFNVYTDRCVMRLDFSTGHFKLLFPIRSIKINGLQYDSLFNVEDSNAVFIYRGVVTQNIFDLFKMQNDGNQYTMDGTITIGNYQWPCQATFDPVNIQDLTDISKFRIDIRLIVDPAKAPFPVFGRFTASPVTLFIKNGSLNGTQ